MEIYVLLILSLLFSCLDWYCGRRYDFHHSCSTSPLHWHNLEPGVPVQHTCHTKSDELKHLFSACQSLKHFLHNICLSLYSYYFWSFRFARYSYICRELFALVCDHVHFSILVSWSNPVCLHNLSHNTLFVYSCREAFKSVMW